MAQYSSPLPPPPHLCPSGTWAPVTNVIVSVFCMTQGFYDTSNSRNIIINITQNDNNNNSQFLKKNNTNNIYLYQKNSCFINRYCFALNEPNPIDWCYQCLPDVSNSTWTKRRGNYRKLTLEFIVFLFIYFFVFFLT